MPSDREIEAAVLWRCDVCDGVVGLKGFAQIACPAHPDAGMVEVEMVPLPAAATARPDPEKFSAVYEAAENACGLSHYKDGHPDWEAIARELYEAARPFTIRVEARPGERARLREAYLAFEGVALPDGEVGQ